MTEESTYHTKQDHPGNVRALVSDVKKLEFDGSGNITGIPPDVLSASDYYPFGWLMPGRFYPSLPVSGEGYRYGFNGKEKLDEITGVTGNQSDFGDRIYNSRIGRWISLDPLMKKYPDLSPYHFTGNNPIRFVDFNGQDFGIKVNHKAKTIIIVENVYTTSEKSYKQALMSSRLWNAKTTTVGGYKVSFQVSVQKPVSVTQEEVLKFNPSLVRKNGKIKKYKYQIARDKLASSKAHQKSVDDDIGNVYAGNNGYYSQNVSGSSYVGGTTANAKYISMNTLIWREIWVKMKNLQDMNLVI